MPSGAIGNVAELLLREEQPVLEWLHELGQQAICTPAGKKQQQQSGAISVPARLLQWRPQQSAPHCASPC